MGKSLYIITLKSDKIVGFEKIILKCILFYIPADIFCQIWLISLMSFYLILNWRGKRHWTKSPIEFGLLDLFWTHHDIDNSNFLEVYLSMFFFWSCLSGKRFCQFDKDKALTFGILLLKRLTLLFFANAI